LGAEAGGLPKFQAFRQAASGAAILGWTGARPRRELWGDTPLPEPRPMTEPKGVRALTPSTIRPPFAAYSHGAFVPAGAAWVFTSGQLGITVADEIPESAEAQADLCFAAVDAILAEAGFSRTDTVRINAFVTDRAHMQGYMAARDRWCAGLARLPASTLVIVSGFTREEFKVEVDVAAARLP
jgi:enamine deaminase RidA (YjgF/YER057c/UK114 family)